MSFIKVGDREIEVDKDGFLVNSDDWDEDVACAIAATQGINELSDKQWHSVRYLRDYYMKYGVLPQIRRIVKEAKLSKWGGLTEFYQKLFAQGPLYGAACIAGVPREHTILC
ncbi:MAG: TusE/DsrC/DsvC family sulfur relay protein [Patescibacteria group bacterium]